MSNSYLENINCVKIISHAIRRSVLSVCRLVIALNAFISIIVIAKVSDMNLKRRMIVKIFEG